ncbi:MAG: hypothetical protein A2X36_08545 [Elusimicrobia bacterium GWA2_69_24]|nr:MAG: hypothetical protein A2X36_08545 [Elusimicrobia bacterium GWA2_69_24]HBL16566.1 hypothetical protein [Elusimicrobiota bacterium]
MKKKEVKMTVDLQCGACGALVHKGENPPKFCPCCGAGFERYCITCRKRVDMFFEEWWPEEEECVRTYSPAKRCPTCNASLEVEDRGKPQGGGTAFEH